MSIAIPQKVKDIKEESIATICSALVEGKTEFPFFLNSVTAMVSKKTLKNFYGDRTRLHSDLEWEHQQPTEFQGTQHPLSR